MMTVGTDSDEEVSIILVRISLPLNLRTNLFLYLSRCSVGAVPS